ncbi:MAG: hypothetical protein B6245_18435 [Desulfobacteraceae bacterium 4572_88]|nr:MAG: hypothetical protein B6245_18435 [Desulfobacteraceae bacterium 4572_88]RLC18300.1 MAG: DNA polymerase III subunit gamma/tau [Deltaproteobacteria bacterium]
MSYLVLARKYRPQTFDQVVEQAHVTQTLANAISSGRVAHAILFSGPRGTGKTTIARILAKSMNCKAGPTPTPCNECQSCKEITSGSAADVFEIDGASNNGVEQIRELRENVKYMPAHSLYKIYIIDEVHMLSIAAFNALLKTLEEPPAHVMFLFATTEPHKIPITILSRCQRHDLRRVPLESVSGHMKFLCDQEETEIDGESLELIARESGGSMRDALSLLDQVITSSDGPIRHEQVLDILGVIDRSILSDISANILSGDVPDILDILDKIYAHGHNIKNFYSALTQHFRNLLVIRMGKKIDKLVDLPANETKLMARQVETVSEHYLSQILDILLREEAAIRLSAQPKLALEMAFIRMFQVKPVLSIDLLIEKLDKLREGIGELQETSTSIPAQPVISEVSRKQTVPRVQETASAPYESQPPEPPLPEDLLPEPPEIRFSPDDPPERTWEKLLEIILGKKSSLYGYLSKCALKNLTEQSLEIEVRGNKFTLGRINKDETLIQNICDDFFGKKMAIEIRAKESAKDDRQQKKKQKEQLRQDALGNPLVGDIVDIFGGRVVEVRVL